MIALTPRRRNGPWEPATDVGNACDCPSGHPVPGWPWATIPAERLPERAIPTLVRTHASGENRIVCSVHHASAVGAGYTSASLSVVRASSSYQAYFETAHRELSMREDTGTAPDPAQWRAQSDLLAQNIFNGASRSIAP